MAVTVASLITKMGYDDTELVAGLGSSAGLLSSFMSGFAGILETGVLAAGAAVGVIGESFMSIQDALTPVMTLTGESSKQFQDLSASIDNLIAHSPRSADDIGMAAYKILSAGITDTTAATNALTASNELALAGLGSVTQAADLVSSAMTVWRDAGLTADQAARTFFGTIQVGKTTTAELASGFGTIAPLAEIAGLSLNDLMSATAALTVTGMPAATAYTNLRNILSNIVKPTKTASAEAKTLGIEFNTAALRSEGLRTFLTDVWAKTSGDPDKIAKLFGNIRGLTGAIALMGPEADAYATDIDSINAKGSLLGERSNEVANTLSNRFKEMKNNVTVYLHDLGQQGLDWLTAKWQIWGDSITSVTSHLADDIKAILIAVKNHFLDFVTGWTSSGADSPSGFFENLGSIARGAYEEMLKIFRDLKTFFLDFVTGWSDGGEGSPSGFWQNLGSVAERVAQSILGFFAAVKTAFQDFITGWTSSGADSPSGFFENLGSKASGVKDDIINWFNDIKTAFNDFKTGWNSEGNDSPAGFWENFGSKAQGALTTVKQVFTDIGVGFTAFTDTINGDGGRAIEGGVKGPFEKAGLAIRDLRDNWNKIWDDIKTKWDTVWAGIKQFVEVQWPLITDGLKNGLDTIKQSFQDFHDKILPQFRGDSELIGNLLVILGGVLTVVTASWDGNMRLMSNSIGGFALVAGASIGVVTGLLEGPAMFWASIIRIVGDLINGNWSGAWHEFINATRGFLGTVNAFFAGVPGMIMGYFYGAGGWLYAAGRAIIQGLINGIEDSLGPLGSVLSGIENLAKVKKGPPAHDKVILFDAGRFLIQGLMGGIESQLPALANQFSGINASIPGMVGSSSSTTNHYAGPGNITINMPHGSNGDDVVRALRGWQQMNGRIPIAVSGTSV